METGEYSTYWPCGSIIISKNFQQFPLVILQAVST